MPNGRNDPSMLAPFAGRLQIGGSAVAYSQHAAKPKPTSKDLLHQQRGRSADRSCVRSLGAGTGLTMPSGPGVINESLIAEIAAGVPPPIATFLLTCQQRVRGIITQQRCCRTNTVQLVDRLVDGSYDELREALPGISLVQVVHVTGPESVDEAMAAAEHVDAVLLDSGNPSLAIKELGGTGRCHDWSISRKIRKQLDVPIFLAGGLTPENICEAVQAVGPFGLDLCTGVRTNGKLDEQKLRALFSNLETVMA